MKTTVDIPDELYRRVKAKSALEGKRIRDLTIELYERWLGADERWSAERTRPDVWLRDWLASADEALTHAPPGPTASELLADARARLEPPR